MTFIEPQEQRKRMPRYVVLHNGLGMKMSGMVLLYLITVQDNISVVNIASRNSKRQDHP